MVSVIIPVYNTEKFVGRCLMSVLEQTYTDLEIIIIDDGSTDDSFKICQGFSQKDNRVKILSQKNLGASIARNNGINHAKGDSLMFVDSDDWIDKTMVESLYKLMDFVTSDIVISQMGENKPYQIETNVNSDLALAHVLRDRIWWGPCGKLFRRSVFQEIRFPKPTLSEDYWFMIHLLLKGVNVYYTPMSFYHRNIRKGSLSRMSLCNRSFDELDNVLSVCESVRLQKPVLQKYAERNLVETILKLSNSIRKSTSKGEYQMQKKRIHSIAHNYLCSVLFNNVIPLKQKLLFILYY